jgi:hypothetical protein
MSISLGELHARLLVADAKIQLLQDALACVAAVALKSEPLRSRQALYEVLARDEVFLDAGNASEATSEIMRSLHLWQSVLGTGVEEYLALFDQESLFANDP